MIARPHVLKKTASAPKRPARFVLRHTGGPFPPEHLSTIQAHPGVVIVNRTDNALLIHGPLSLEGARAIVAGLPGWVVTQETFYQLQGGLSNAQNS